MVRYMLYMNNHGESDRSFSQPKFAIMSQLLVQLLMATYIYNAFTPLPYRKAIQVSLAVVVLLVAAYELREVLVFQDIVVGVILLCYMLFYRYMSHPGAVSLSNTFVRVAICFVLGLLFRHSLINKKLLIGYLIIVITPFIYTLFVLKVQPQSFFYRMNRNSIAYYLVFAVSLYILYAALNNQKYISMLLTICVLMASFASNSRTGLLMASLLFFLVILNNVYSGIRSAMSANNVQYKYLKAMTIVLIIAGVGISILVVSFLFEHSRFITQGFSSSGRNEIYKQYFEQLNFKKLVFGVRPEQYKVIDWHNSYISMLAFFGIFSFPLFGIIIFALAKFIRQNWMLAGLLLLWILYSIPETVSPYGHGDYLLVPLLMIAFPPKRLNIPISLLLDKVRDRIGI